ncbi:MAG: leucyl/phenylalanyl-tRNA--protein transferase [Muribaculaceae bacterium]|nr:leucyl/phenylalanyl-tRNA--protein transferase [Muribaculaceae bacterium]MDE6681869.1 leucyl/phenylalanyl-tRNA--protein transferase [Muribaculaceae bacterium]
MVYQIYEDSLEFPDPRCGEPDGLFAIGGDLSADRLLLAYSLGIFPWFSFRDYDEPMWYCPMERFVIFPEEIHISHSMRTMMNKGEYEVTMNKDFSGVINGCSEGRIDEEGAWLGERMIEAYSRLHELGFASSVEVWRGANLAGGLYGVTIGNAFFGESMFSREPGASKLALIGLARIMQEKGGALIDCQFETPHLKSMGGRFIPYDEYLRLIRRPFWLQNS